MQLPSIPDHVYIGFFVSLLVTILLVLTKRWHARFSMDGVQGIQKQHTSPTPRIGGVAIVLGVFASWAMTPHAGDDSIKTILGPLLLAGLPAFVFGLAEDLTKKVTVRARLLATMASGMLGWWLTNVSITSLGIPGVDTLLGITTVSVVFTAFAISGVANAINIIDGFNGLASGFVVLALAGVAAMAIAGNDIALGLACLCVASAVLGFWLVNWPWGKMFLGDGGSYFGGFAVAWGCIMLVERNQQITPFAPLLLCIHPVTEVLFSIYRRRLRKSHPGHPDRLHLHSLMLRRVVRPMLSHWFGNTASIRQFDNALTGLLLACMTLPAAVAAYALRSQALIAAIMCVLFMLGYVTIYARLVRMRWFSPLMFLFVKPN